MLSVVLIASVYIAWIARKREQLAGYGFSGKIKGRLWEHTFEFSSILATVLSSFHLLLLFNYWGWQSVSIDNLIRLENALNWFHTLVSSTLKISWERTLLIMLIVFLLGLFQLRLVEEWTVSKKFKSLRKGLKLLNKAAILLCALTILGQDSGQPESSGDTSTTHRAKREEKPHTDSPDEALI